MRGGGGITPTGKKPRDLKTADIVVCGVCGHTQLHPIPLENEIQEYYDNNKQDKALNINIQEVFKRNLAWTEQQISRIQPFSKKAKSILEIGSGYGLFLKKMKDDLGYNIDGIEISEERRNIAKQHCSAQIYSLNLLKENTDHPAYNRKYDLIVSFHVLEHISNPKLFLKNTKRLLSEGGTLVFEVPNVNERFLDLCDKYNDFKWLSAHISYFSAATLERLFASIPFSHIEVRGVQNYSIENHLHWIKTGLPSIDMQQINHPAGLEWINRVYKEALEHALIGDALMVVAKI